MVVRPESQMNKDLVRGYDCQAWLSSALLHKTPAASHTTPEMASDP